MNSEEINRITEIVIGAAIEVHRGSDRVCLSQHTKGVCCAELELRNVDCAKEVDLPVEYKGLKLDCGSPVDLLICGLVVVEVKPVDQLAKIHEVQLLTYLKLGNWPVGLLINFNVAVLKDGIKRRVLNLSE